MSESEAGPTMMEEYSPHWEPRIIVPIFTNCPLAVRDQLISRNRKLSNTVHIHIVAVKLTGLAKP